MQVLQRHQSRLENTCLSACVAEVFSCVSAQHHHWGSEGAERHWRAAAGSGGRRRQPPHHHLTAPQHRPQETGSTVLQTGGECEFSFMSVCLLFTAHLADVADCYLFSVCSNSILQTSHTFKLTTSASLSRTAQSWHTQVQLKITLRMYALPIIDGFVKILSLLL